MASDSKIMAEKTLDKEHDFTSIGPKHFAGFYKSGLNYIGYLGLKDNSDYIIVSFYRKIETINKNDPKLRESESSHVVCKFYRISFEQKNKYIHELIDEARRKTKISPLTKKDGYTVID
jgi:hypothetical protein